MLIDLRFTIQLATEQHIIDKVLPIVSDVRETKLFEIQLMVEGVRRRLDTASLTRYLRRLKGEDTSHISNSWIIDFQRLAQIFMTDFEAVFTLSDGSLFGLLPSEMLKMKKALTLGKIRTAIIRKVTERDSCPSVFYALIDKTMYAIDKYSLENFIRNSSIEPDLVDKVDRTVSFPTFRGVEYRLPRECIRMIKKVGAPAFVQQFQIPTDMRWPSTGVKNTQTGSIAHPYINLILLAKLRYAQHPRDQRISKIIEGCGFQETKPEWAIQLSGPESSINPYYNALYNQTSGRTIHLQGLYDKLGPTVFEEVKPFDKLKRKGCQIVLLKTGRYWLDMKLLAKIMLADNSVKEWVLNGTKPSISQCTEIQSHIEEAVGRRVKNRYERTDYYKNGYIISQHVEGLSTTSQPQRQEPVLIGNSSNGVNITVTPLDNDELKKQKFSLKPTSPLLEEVRLRYLLLLFRERLFRKTQSDIDIGVVSVGADKFELIVDNLGVMVNSTSQSVDRIAIDVIRNKHLSNLSDEDKAKLRSVIIDSEAGFLSEQQVDTIDTYHILSLAINTPDTSPSPPTTSIDSEQNTTLVNYKGQNSSNASSLNATGEARTNDSNLTAPAIEEVENYTLNYTDIGKELGPIIPERSPEDFDKFKQETEAENAVSEVEQYCEQLIGIEYLNLTTIEHNALEEVKLMERQAKNRHRRSNDVKLFRMNNLEKLAIEERVRRALQKAKEQEEAEKEVQSFELAAREISEDYHKQEQIKADEEKKSLDEVERLERLGKEEEERQALKDVEQLEEVAIYMSQQKEKQQAMIDASNSSSEEVKVEDKTKSNSTNSTGTSNTNTSVDVADNSTERGDTKDEPQETSPSSDASNSEDHLNKNELEERDRSLEDAIKRTRDSSIDRQDDSKVQSYFSEQLKEWIRLCRNEVRR